MLYQLCFIVFPRIFYGHNSGNIFYFFLVVVFYSIITVLKGWDKS